jgi:PAS domain S-box-containing protein
LTTRYTLSFKPLAFLLWAGILGGLYLTRLYSYLLFHSLAELFSITIACGVFLVAWNARRSLGNSYLLYVAIAYFFAASLDVFHLLSYKGMGVFPGFDANAPTQLWIAARYFQSLALLAAPWLADRRVNPARVIAGCGMIAALLAATVFAGIFPDCYVEGKGLTPFKIYSEYAIALIFTGSIVLLRTGRSRLGEDVLSRLVASIGVMVLAEIFFTLYGRDVYGFFNLLGHFLKIVSFYLLYRAVIATDFIGKLERLARDLGRSEEEARDARARLEERVAARTAELHDAIARLAAELAERQRAQEEARHLASFPEMNPKPVLEVAMSGAVIFANPAARRLTEAHGEGKGLSSLLPEDLDAILGDRETAGERALNREVRLGGRVFEETIFFPPSLGAARIYAHEITDRVRAEEALRAANAGLETRVSERTSELRRTSEQLRDALRERTASERRLAEQSGILEKIFSNIHLCVVYLDAQFNFVRVNRAYADAWGHPPEFFDGKNLFDLYPHAENEAIFRRTVEAGEPHTAYAEPLEFPDSTERRVAFWDWTVQPVRGATGEVHGVIYCLIDVTRAKELEHLVRVREKMSALGHVSAGIAHEIRNPLSGINIYVSNLEHLLGRADGLDPEEKEKAARIVGKINSASEKISSVIQKVMEFSKPVPPRMERVQVNVAVEEAVRLSMAEMQKRGVRLEKCLAPDLPPCRADLRLIEQVVLNLINNAAQAMEGIEGLPRIEVISFLDRDRVVVRVSDSGPGIPPGIRSRIFDPFFTTRKEGYGIGLSFSHRVISDHGGLLSAGTSRWGGAEFRVEIPCVMETTVA